MLLNCAVQTYAWGKHGSNSKVAQLAEGANPHLVIDETETYAELWMGTHPKGPSKVRASDQTLEEWIAQHPISLGDKVSEHFQSKGQLPFLFKVLSVNKSLSIQAHPNKQHAEALHKERPDKYPDANHKPEIAIALTPFEGLCGFRQKTEIVTFLKAIPELCHMVGTELVEELAGACDANSEKSVLKNCFTALMSCDKNRVEQQLTSLVSRIKSADDKGENTENHLGKLLLRLYSQFPGDVGCFVIYFLNHMQLEPGEAMFLEANLPHAYLSGDCMECMACSDNVVRAGLTPKYIDVPNLCNMLNYECKPASNNFFTPKQHPNDNSVTIYDPPVPDFTVARIKVDGKQKYEVESLDSGSILILVQGDGQLTGSSANREVATLSKGSVLYIPAHEQVEISCSSPLLMFRAYCNLV